jgi:hypothetical protein
MSTQPESVAEMAKKSANTEIGVPGETAVLAVWEYLLPTKVGPAVRIEDRFGGKNEKGDFVGSVIRMPKGAEIIGVGKDPTLLSIKIFAWVNTGEREYEQRRFFVALTNQPLPTRAEAANAMGSEQVSMIPRGSYHAWGKFWHLFEVCGERGKTG